MSILDDDATILKKTEEYVNKEMIRLYLEDQLPPHLADELVKTLIDEFMKNRLVNKRDASYDFCYLYFQRNKGKLGGKNMECSCMHLWSYLASWGMLRGSSALLQCSPAVLKELIKYLDLISTSAIWSADVNTYDSNTKQLIIDVYNKIASILKNNTQNVPSVTLVTKIMLGVFGCVPAFDTFFTKTFRVLYDDFRSVRDTELSDIMDFYIKHKAIIDKMAIPVIDFGENPTSYHYKKAKLIDMFGFMVGQHIKL